MHGYGNVNGGGGINGGGINGGNGNGMGAGGVNNNNNGNLDLLLFQQQRQRMQELGRVSPPSTSIDASRQGLGPGQGLAQGQGLGQDWLHHTTHGQHMADRYHPLPPLNTTTPYHHHHTPLITLPPHPLSLSFSRVSVLVGTMDDPDDTTPTSATPAMLSAAAGASLAFGGIGGGSGGVMNGLASGNVVGVGLSGNGLHTMSSSLGPSLNEIIATLANGENVVGGNVNVNSGAGAMGAVMDATTTTTTSTTIAFPTTVVTSTPAKPSIPHSSTPTTTSPPPTSESTSGKGGGIGSTLMLQVKTLHPEVLKQLMASALQPLIAKHKPFLAKTLTEYLVNNASPAGDLPDPLHINNIYPFSLNITSILPH